MTFTNHNDKYDGLPKIVDDDSQLKLDLNGSLLGYSRYDTLRMDESKLNIILMHKSLLASVATRLISSAPFKDIIREIFDFVCRNIGIKRIDLYFLDSEVYKICCSDDNNLNDSGYLITDIHSSPFSKIDWIIERIKNGKEVVLADHSVQDKKIQDFIHNENIGIVLMLPFGFEEKTIGVMTFCEEKGYIFNSVEYQFYKTFTNIIAYALERENLFYRRIETERKHREAIETLEKNLRLASIGTLTTGIAHEINQPLNALSFTIDGTIYWLEQNYEITREELFEKLRFISNRIKRINEIIEQMRGLVRGDWKDKYAQINTNDTIEDAISLLKHKLLSANINIMKDLDKELPQVLGNHTQIQQIVVNILNNSIYVLNSTFKRDRIIWISSKKEEGYCILDISDNGPGIDEDIIGKIFDLFFTTKDSSECMGFGLSIVKNIITRMGGTVKAENRKDGGARFIIKIHYNL